MAGCHRCAHSQGFAKAEHIRPDVEVLKGKTVLAIGKPTAKALETSGVEDAIVSKEATVKDAIGCLAADCVNRALGLLGSDDSTAEADRSR